MDKSCFCDRGEVLQKDIFELIDQARREEREKVMNLMIRRVWAMPNKETFMIKPIAELLKRYEVGTGWADPFAGWSKLAEFRNDVNPERQQTYQMDAEQFASQFYDEQLVGLLFDPPYSLTQLKECYGNIGQAMSQMESQRFPQNVKEAFVLKLAPGAVVISFGWNSQGFGKNLGFEIVEILLVAHGRSHNDTIITIERKL